MSLTIEQALQQGLTAHNNQQLEEAERLYRYIIQIDPAHGDANHNMGALMVSRHQSHIALPFFMTALEGNSKIEQYWVSQIDALIRLQKINDAKKLLKKARLAGFFVGEFDWLSLRVLSPTEQHAKGKIFQAEDGYYLEFLRALHDYSYETYFEIGTRDGASLTLCQSPSISIDPYYQLKHDPLARKDFCLMFQDTSDNFFENTLPKFSHLRCQLGFIDGMHLFEYALKDFINLAKISSEKSLFLFHDALPFSYRMATRDNKILGQGEAWTGDIWKLIFILMDVGLQDNVSLLTSAPTGILAVLNPEQKIITKLEENYDEICVKWLDVELDQDKLLNIYQSNIFKKPETYLRSLEKISFGKKVKSNTREWVSQ